MPYEPILNFMGNMQESEENRTSKNFDSWNSKKKVIENSDRSLSCNPGDVWWCSLGLNIGREEDGKNEDYERPVLIVRNLSKDTCLCIPLTSSQEKHPFRIPLPSFYEKSHAVISQIRTVSTKRLLRLIGSVSSKDFRTVKDSLHVLIK